MTNDKPVNGEASTRNKLRPDFKVTEAARPDWDENVTFRLHKTKNPEWRWGSGASDGGASLTKDHVEIDPQAEDRDPMANYKLLISGVIPRPIGFISTRSVDGKSTNLAPMSYTQVVNHDPPVFCIGFAGGFEKIKDTLRNLVESGECVINMISEHFIEAANACSIDTPYGVSEWSLSGLTPAACTNVKASRVKESIFSIECKLMETREFESRKNKGRKQGVMVLVEGVRFWVREDAINEEKTVIDPAVLRPMCRLGGMQYGRLTQGIEILRPKVGRDLTEDDMMRNLGPNESAHL